MSSNKDLLSLWMDYQKETSDKSRSVDSQSVQTGDKKLNDVQEAPAEEIPPERRAKASLNGRLSEFLEKQASRDIISSSEKLTSKPQSWSIDDRDDRAIVSMSLILTSHLVRFSQTRLSESHLLHTRDSILHTMTASDAVKAEVEAYEILNWFAGAMNEAWKEPRNEQLNSPIDSEYSSSVESIIQYAIQNHIDLEMHYYTGSRGEFSDRRITPIEITAEKYLIAFCHLRNEERVFRLSRIVQLSPAEKILGYEKLCYPMGKDTLLPPLPALPEKIVNKNKSDGNKKQSASSKRQSVPKSKKTNDKKQTESGDSSVNNAPNVQTDKKIKRIGKEKSAKKVAPRQRSLFET